MHLQRHDATSQKLYETPAVLLVMTTSVKLAKQYSRDKNNQDQLRH